MLPSRTATLIFGLLLTTSLPGLSQALSPQAARALSEDPEERDLVIASLRDLGAAGVDALLEVLSEASLGDRNTLESLVLDRVCGQRDCAASRLFWYTDLDQALAAAQRLGRPVLSLRLLGRLDEDLSCANSRFFRTALYPDPRVGKLLRKRFGLHWHSVRPVPKITIDYGDGRSLQGTITGNSAHYVLDRHGRLVDVLPGLYGPGAFAAELQAAGTLAGRAGEISEGGFLRWMRHEHSTLVRALDLGLGKSLGDVGSSSVFGRLLGELEAFASLPTRHLPPTARQASLLAKSKMMVEGPALAALEGPPGDLEELPGEDVWPKLARARHRDVALRAESRALLRRIHRPAEPGDGDRALEAFEAGMALDTVRNQFLLRRTVHVWLQDREAGLTPELLDEQIYASLFRTPLSDPWIGLRPADIYSGLQVVEAPSEAR